MKDLFAYYAALSRGQRTFLNVLFVLVVLPFTAMIGLQAFNAFNLAMLGSELATRSDAWKAEAQALDARMDPESLKSVANQHAYRLLSSHGELVPERRVIVTVQVPLKDPKARQTAVTTEDLLNRAAEQVQALGAEECALLTGSLASQCTVMSATGRPLGSEAYEYQFQLAFAERRPFGKSDPDGRYEFVLSRSSPGKAATNQRIYFEKSAAQRQRIYFDVAETCDAIRRKTGNCSVTGLSIASRLDRGTPMARLSASAAYASLVEVSRLAASAH
jgi:hypothetical protein